MADNTVLNPGSGGDTFAADDIGGIKHPRTKLEWGVDGAAVDASASNPLPVALTGTQAATPVTDNGGTLSIDDGGGAITVDGTVSISGALDSELTTADVDTGAGTDTRAVVGLVRAESGGGTLVGSANPLPVNDAGGSLTVDDGGGSLTVDGTVTANAGTGPFPVSDNGGSLTVDGTVTGNQGSANTAANAWPMKLTDGTDNLDLLTAVASDTGQVAVPVRVVSQLGAGSGLAGTIDAPADNKTPTLAQHVQAFLSVFDGTNWDQARGDTTNGLDVDVTRLPSLPAGAAVIGKVDINSAPQVAVNNVETIADNAGFTDGTSKLFPQGYIFDEVAGTALTENDIAAARIDSKRAVVNVLEDATTRGQRAKIGAAGGLLGDQGLPNGSVANAWPIKSTDGTNVAAVKAASTAATAADPALVVAVNPGTGVTQGTAAAQTNAWFTRPRKLATYRAVVRATARPYVLAAVNGAAGRKQVATIHHAAVATKTVRLRRVRVGISTFTAATFVAFDLARVTAAPATGNPAVTVGPTDPADAAFEATVLGLPTTAGTEGAIISTYTFRAGITGGASTLSPPPGNTEFDLLGPSTYDDEVKAAVIRAGTLEGWAVTFDSDAANTANVAYVIFEFTEE